VLQSVAACCSVLQCVAVCCSVLQCVAVCCSRIVSQKIVFQNTAETHQDKATDMCTWVNTHMHMYMSKYSYAYVHEYILICICKCRRTQWRRCIGCLKLQVSFRKRATHYKALLREMTCKNKAFHVIGCLRCILEDASSLPPRHKHTHTHTYA